MNSDFTVCPHGECRKPAQAAPRVADLLQRLDDLMRRCREEQHDPTYADLQQVREAV